MNTLVQRGERKHVPAACNQHRILSSDITSFYRAQYCSRGWYPARCFLLPSLWNNESERKLVPLTVATTTG